MGGSFLYSPVDIYTAFIYASLGHQQGECTVLTICVVQLGTVQYSRNSMKGIGSGLRCPALWLSSPIICPQHSAWLCTAFHLPLTL